MGWGSFRDKITKPFKEVGSAVEDWFKEGGIGGEELQSAIDDIRGKTGEKAASKAARTQAEAMTQQLDYLKEINRLPQELKEKALTQMSDIFLGGEGQQAIIDRAKASPIYSAIMGGQQAGEEAIMRQAGATGGLRSGNVQEALYDYNTQLKNQALMSSYGDIMGGIQSLAGTPTYGTQIAQTYGDIGETQAAGILGAASARQAGTANLFNLGLGLGGLGLGIARL